MSSLFKQFLVNGKRTHRYRLKTIVELNDERMAQLEKYLSRFNIVDMSGVEKTIHHTNPLDFPSIQEGEVYWVDFELEYAASPYEMQQHIYKMLGTADKFVVVMGENAPYELQLQEKDAYAEMDEEAKENGETRASAMSTPDYPEAQEVDATEYYGDRYNHNLVSTLSRMEREKKLPDGVKNVARPFEWLDENKETKLDGDVRPVSKTGKYGENYQNTTEVKRTYRTDDKTSTKSKTVHVTTPEVPHDR